MELAIETFFRIVIAIFVTMIVIFLVNYYYQKMIKVKLPVSTNRGGLQIFDINSDYDLAKVIYGCYSQSNFGEISNRVDCYIIKINTTINDQNVSNILFNDFGLGNVYENIDFSSLNNDVLLVYYENGLVRFTVVS